MLGNGWTARHKFGVATNKFFRNNALVHFQKVGISVQVVEVLQKGKVHCHFNVLVTFPLGKDGSQVNGKLLVADGVLQNAFANGLQTGNALLLLLFVTACYGNFPADVVVVAMAVELMSKPNCLELGTGSQNDAHARVGVYVKLVVGFQRKLLPTVKVVGAF